MKLEMPLTSRVPLQSHWHCLSKREREREENGEFFICYMTISTTNRFLTLQSSGRCSKWTNPSPFEFPLILCHNHCYPRDLICYSNDLWLSSSHNLPSLSHTSFWDHKLWPYFAKAGRWHMIWSLTKHRCRVLHLMFLAVFKGKESQQQCRLIQIPSSAMKLAIRITTTSTILGIFSHNFPRESKWKSIHCGSCLRTDVDVYSCTAHLPQQRHDDDSKDECSWT